MSKERSEEQREIKEVQIELTNAEKKLRKLFERRNEWNAKGGVLKKERNSLNEKRRKVISNVRELRDTRHREIEELKRKCDEIVAPYRRERDRLNTMVQLQKEKRRGKRSADDERYGGNKERKKDPVTEMNMLTMERQIILDEYEITAMSRKAEKDTMEKVKRLDQRIKELKREIPDHQREEVQRIEQYMTRESIDHSAVRENVVQLSQKAQHFHELFSKERKRFNEQMNNVYEKYQKLIDELEGEIGSLMIGADRKHKEFLETREKADHYHKRAVEYRRGVILVTKERDGIMDEISRTMEEHNRSVEDSLMDEKKKEEAEDSALELLKKGKKITF